MDTFVQNIEDSCVQVHAIICIGTCSNMLNIVSWSSLVKRIRKTIKLEILSRISALFAR